MGYLKRGSKHTPRSFFYPWEPYIPIVLVVGQEETNIKLNCKPNREPNWTANRTANQTEPRTEPNREPNREPNLNCIPKYWGSVTKIC